MKNTAGIIFAILASVCFGFLGIFAEFGYENGSNPTTVLGARFTIATILILIMIIIGKKSLRVTKKQLIYLFLIGSVGYTLTTQMLFLSYKYIGVGLATGIHFIYPLCVCIFAFIFAGEKFTKKKTIALIISIIGVFLLSASEKSGLDIRGIGLALASGVVYGATVFAMGKEEVKNLNSLVVTFYCSAFAGLITIIIGLVTNKLVFKIDGGIIFSYLGIALISTVLALVLLQIAIREIGPSKSSILGTFEPIVGIIASAIILGEHIDLFTIIGIIAVVISVVLVAKE